MKPPFGTMNATIAKTIALNSPKYRRIVEPFADGGTYALHVGHKPAREHIINIVDEALFGAMTFAQQASSSDRSRLKRQDWIASQETFDAVMRITAAEGADAFYRFLYVKKFGMQMDPEQPPEFDVLKTGQDISATLYALPMMRAMLKSATITNDEPLSLLGRGGSDTLFILLPKSPEDAEAVQSRLSGVSGNVFAAWKVVDVEGVIGAAKRFGDKIVSPLAVASIMMNTMATVTNYESKLVPIDPTTGGMADMNTRGTAQTAARPPEQWSLRSATTRRRMANSFRRITERTALRIIRREEAEIMRAARRIMGQRDATELQAFIRQWYADNEEWIGEQMLPILLSEAEEIQAEAAEEVGAEVGMTPEMEEFVRNYLTAYVTRHTGNSRGQLLSIVNEATAQGVDVVEAMQNRFGEWAETRPSRIAEWETNQLANAVAKAVFVAAGVTLLRWVTWGENCPYCDSMNGRVVGVNQWFLPQGGELQPEGADRPMTAPRTNVGHPPLHEGCDCGVVAELGSRGRRMTTAELRARFVTIIQECCGFEEAMHHD